MNKSARSNSLRAYLCALVLIAAAPLAFGQGSKMNSPYEPIAEKDRDQPIKRDQWFMHGRLVPGESAAALRYRAHLQKMQMRAARIAAEQNGLAPLSQILAAPASWVSLGPAPLASDASGGSGQQDYNWVSGRATAIAIDPADPTGNTVFIGGAFGGVWKSTNAGSLSPSPASLVWTPVTDTQASLSGGAIAIQPGNSNPATSVVLVGTGEANGSGDSYFGLGILRSADGGSTWNLISTANGGALSFAGLGASRMAFSTAQKNTVVVAMATSPVGLFDGLITAGTQRGLYQSTDAGLSWTFRTPTDPGGPINPLTSATSVVYNATALKFFAAVRYHGFYSSPDGVTWTRLTAQPGGAVLSTTACPVNYLTPPTPCPMYRGEITVVPGRNEMYVWYVDINETDRGIWKTTNGGTSWTQVPDNGAVSITNCGDSFGCGTSQGSYNLELAAVPNGSATDLYAGAINIYKCTVNSGASACSTGSWLNLTHVYGCSSIAKVHPDQHALDYIVAGGNDLMYFANDGGIYRALDGYTGLHTGTCGMTNSFDSLNQTLGSMTQFVSFSQHPTDPHTILGGTQDNGSPATASAQTSTSWLNVNGGDGGYNEINPNNATEWFASNTDVSIQRCTSGISCNSGLFGAPIIGNNQVGGDFGAFYTPFILDPQNTGDIIVGTCRVWRGASDGTGSGWATGGGTALSPDFEGGVPPCSGGETNLVKALAAGGPSVGGVSNVIYAATDGFGTAFPGGGHIWVTTNATASGVASTWTNRTGTINTLGYPISGVAIDKSDASGNTAYLTVMGFHTQHVWKTTNAGSTWTDFTGNLPDNPANAIVVDSTTSPSTIYVGTDLGVFSSSATSASWTELGPAPGSGPGYLPNVPVTALRLFNSAGTKLLRASTYGRGVWEFSLVTTPDFQFSFSNSTNQTIFPTQSATYNGTLTATNGYNSAVTLTCTGTAPTTCTRSPNPVTPTPSGAAFTVTASSAIGDYSFNVHGVGADVNMVTHDAPLTLHVVDFGIGALSPNAVTVNRPSTSQNITFQVTGSGSFSGTVDLGCTGLPTGATCNFSPGNAVTPTAASPVTVTLTIGTSVSTPAGVSTVVVTANTVGAPATKTQNLSVTITANPDFNLVLANSSASASAGSQTTVGGTLTAVNGYSATVNLTCGAGAPPTCTPIPASLTPTSGGASFLVTVSSNAVQNYSFNISASDGTITHTMPVTFSSTFDFTPTDAAGPYSVTAGSPASVMISLTPAGTGNTFPNTTTLSCTSGLPARTTCVPVQVPAGGGQTTATLTITTTAPTVALRRQSGGLFYALWLPLPGLVLVFGGLGRRSLRKKRLTMFMLALVLSLVSLQAACGGGGGGGGGGNPGTPKGTYNVVVTATSGSLSHTVPITLTVQ